MLAGKGLFYRFRQAPKYQKKYRRCSDRTRITEYSLPMTLRGRANKSRQTCHQSDAYPTEPPRPAISICNPDLTSDAITSGSNKKRHEGRKRQQQPELHVHVSKQYNCNRSLDKIRQSFCQFSVRLYGPDFRSKNAFLSIPPMGSTPPPPTPPKKKKKKKKVIYPISD